MPLDLIISLIFLIFSLCFFGLLFYFGIRFLNEELATRARHRNTMHFDQLGNPEFFYDPSTEQHFLPGPGNKAFPEYLQPVQTISQKRTNPGPQIFVGGKPLSEDAGPIEPTSLPTSLPTSVVIGLLSEAIERGENKTLAIKNAFGITGGSRFAKLAKLYDDLKGANNEERSL